jgi:hypothetical protein
MSLYAISTGATQFQLRNHVGDCLRDRFFLPHERCLHMYPEQEVLEFCII